MRDEGPEAISKRMISAVGHRSSRLLKPLALALGMTGLLAACQPTAFGTAQVAKARTTLANGALTVAAPKGWCVDPKSLRNSGAGGFALFGNCAAISGNADDAHAPEPALLSVTVGPPALEDGSGKLSKDRLTKIGEFFHSEIGRAALSRSGEAEDVAIKSTDIADGALLLRVEDRSGTGGPPIAKTYLRGVTALGGRITALSVMPLKEGEMSYAQQRRLLERFIAAIRAAN
ncbi:hypothetical protein AXZ77_0211 [Thioclava sp. ES.031]|nr:hypothetical protein AXZ77_0211 [Thioclava sp. ES.031]